MEGGKAGLGLEGGPHALRFITRVSADRTTLLARGPAGLALGQVSHVSW